MSDDSKIKSMLVGGAGQLGAGDKGVSPATRRAIGQMLADLVIQNQRGELAGLAVAIVFDGERIGTNYTSEDSRRGELAGVINVLNQEYTFREFLAPRYLKPSGD